MAGFQEFKRAMSLQKLLQDKMKDVDETKEPEEQKKEACGLMDKLFGERWKDEASMSPVPVVEIEIESTSPEDQKDVEAFYRRVHKELGKAGWEAPELQYDQGTTENPDILAKRKCKEKKRIVNKIGSLLERLVSD